MSIKDELLVRAAEYAKHNGLLLRDELGFGVHGIVFLAKTKRKLRAPPSKSIVVKNLTNEAETSICA
jgi:hypothetical protein